MIDDNYRNEQVGVICSADGVPELHATELADVQKMARMVDEEPEQESTQAQQPPLPRRSTHEAEEYWGREGGVKCA